MFCTGLRASGVQGRRFFFVLLLAVLFVPPAHAADGADILWPVWGAATLQLAVTVAGGLFLTFHSRAKETEGARVTELEHRIDRLNTQVNATRESFVPRNELNERLTRLNDARKASESEFRHDIASLRTELGSVHSDLGQLRGDVAGLRSEMAGLRSEVTAILNLLSEAR